MDVVRSGARGPGRARELVSLINEHGPLAVGLRRGRGAVRRPTSAAPSSTGERASTSGCVGDVVEVDPRAVLGAARRPGASPSSRRSRPSGASAAGPSTSTPTRPRPPSRWRSAPRSSWCSPTCAGLYRDWPNRDSLVSRDRRAGELEALLPRPRVGHDPEDDRVPRGGRAAACRRPRSSTAGSRTRSCSRSSRSAGIGTEVVPA